MDPDLIAGRKELVDAADSKPNGIGDGSGARAFYRPPGYAQPVIFSPTLVVRSTLLSRRPRPGSALAATFGTACLCAASGLWAADPWKVSAESQLIFSAHQYWRLLSALLAHHDLSHLLSNALPWWGFSYLLYGYFGGWVFPVGTLFFGAIVNLLSITTYPPGDRLLGASGAVYLMGGFWLTLYLLIDRRYAVKRRLLHAMGFALVLMAPQSANAATSYRTHAIGFATGVIWGSLYFVRKRKAIRAAEIVEADSEGSSPPPGIRG